MPLRFSPARGASVLMSASSRGPTGSAATITAGTTTTGAEGTSASVSNSGSTSAAIFDFTVPRGAVPAIGFNFNTATTDSDKTAGDVWFNNATPASVTVIYFDNADRNGNTVTAWLDSFDDSTTTAKGHFVFTPAATPSAKLIYSVSGSVVDGTGYRKVTVAHVAGTTLPSSAAHLAVTFSRTGDKGADGTVAVSGTPLATEYARWLNATTIEARTTTQVRSDIGLVIGTNVQAFDSDLTTWAGLTPSANAQSLVTAADYAAMKVLLALTIGTNVQAFDAELAALAGLTSAADKVPYFTGSGTAALADQTTYARTLLDDANAAAALATLTAMGQGKHTIWIPASAMWARTTNGPGAASRELTTGGDIMVKGWAFDTTTEEAVQFYIAFPKSWNKGTITFQAFWTNVSGLTTETVSWGLSAGAYTDSDAIDTTDLGTEVRVADTWLAANDIHVSAESGAVTVGNTPIDDDMTIGQIARSVANDNMTGDAELLGIKIFYTTSSATDA